MEQLMKFAYIALCLVAIMTFWPLIVLLLGGLVVFILYSSWKTKKMLKESSSGFEYTGSSQKNADVFEAEYTEKEVRHE